MKKPILLLAAMVLLSSSAFAQCSEDANEICIFFSEDCNACTNCLSFVGGASAAYVVLLNGTQTAGVSGYEFCLCNEDGTPLLPPNPAGIFITGYTYPLGAINAATEPCFAVGLATPLAYSPCNTLLTINLLIFAPDTWCFGVEPSVPASIPDAMAYADGADPGLLIQMFPCTESGCFMSCINSPMCPPPVDVEDATWGSVKNLYR